MEVCAAKKVGWEVIFSELWFAGSGACKPRRKFEGSALEPFFHVFLMLNGASIVWLNYHIKASVELVTFKFDRENQIIPWQGVYFFTNTVSRSLTQFMHKTFLLHTHTQSNFNSLVLVISKAHSCLRWNVEEFRSQQHKKVFHIE